MAAAKLLGPRGLLVSVDLLEMAPVRVSDSSGTSSGGTAAAIDTHFIRGDFTSPTTQDQVVQAGLSRRRAFADVVLSDMLQNTSGRHDLDHFRSMDLCHEALAFCDTLMRPGGTFVAKYLRGQVSGWRLGASSPWLVFTLNVTRRTTAGRGGASGGRKAGLCQCACGQAQGVARRVVRDVPRCAGEAGGTGTHVVTRTRSDYNGHEHKQQARELKWPLPPRESAEVLLLAKVKNPAPRNAQGMGGRQRMKKQGRRRKQNQGPHGHRLPPTSVRR